MTLDRNTLLLAMLVLGLAGLVALGVLYYRKRHLQTDVEERFKAFRQQAVQLMDQLDALRKRHKSLPATDPDFTVPMQGATLALYSEVNRDLDGLWDRWLAVMEIWDQAQRRIREGSGLALKPTEEARKLLEGGEIDDLVRQSTSCKDRLDRLNQAHEQARAGPGNRPRRAGRDAWLGQQGDGGGPAGRSPSSRDRGGRDRLRQAETMITADPIGAEGLILQARHSLSVLARIAPTVACPGTAASRRPTSSSTSSAAAAERLRAAAARLGARA